MAAERPSVEAPVDLHRTPIRSLGLLLSSMDLAEAERYVRENIENVITAKIALRAAKASLPDADLVRVLAEHYKASSDVPIYPPYKLDGDSLVSQKSREEVLAFVPQTLCELGAIPEGDYWPNEFHLPEMAENKRLLELLHADGKEVTRKVIRRKGGPNLIEFSKETNLPHISVAIGILEDVLETATTDRVYPDVIRGYPDIEYLTIRIQPEAYVLPWAAI